MFDKIIKRHFYLKKHLDAPLLEERIQYLRYFAERGRSRQTLKTIAENLLRIVEFLSLETERVITITEIEEAADRWASHQYNHPQKRIPFSKRSKERFTWYAINWLKKLNRLETLPEESIPLFTKIFERRKALQRHTSAPLLKERLMYLEYWTENGAVESSLRKISQYLLVIMHYLNLYKLRIVSANEIERAADCWARNKKIYKRKSDYSKAARARFISAAIGWLDMLGCLEKSVKKNPFEDLLDQYVMYMREEQGLSGNTIKARIYLLQNFLVNINEEAKAFVEITPLLVDKVLTKKYNIDGYSRRSIQSYASVVRSFLTYAGNKGWCQINLGNSIKAPRVYKQESLPYSPSWDDVRHMLESSKTDYKTDIRNYAILLLLTVYGMRCSEVTHLCLNDLDWINELLYIRRAKNSKPQTFPLTRPVGEAILNYLKQVRPNNRVLRNEIFLGMRAPYRPLSSGAIYQIVSKRLRPLNLNIKHYGPHALRHACATKLINSGFTIKEVSDHLGHQLLDTTRIYAKVDLTNLRKVAEFDLGDLL